MGVAQYWGSPLDVYHLGLGSALVDQVQVLVAALGLFGAPRQEHHVQPQPFPLP